MDRRAIRATVTEQAVPILLAVMVVVVGVGAGVSIMATDQAKAASVQASGFSVTDHAVEAAGISEIFIKTNSPSVTWQHAPEPVESATFRVYIQGPEGEMHEVYSDTCKGSDSPTSGTCQFEAATNGTTTFEHWEHSLADAGWSMDAFEPEPGESVSHTIDVTAEVEVSWGSDSMVDSSTDSATITVTHPRDEARDPSMTVDWASAEVVVRTEE